MKINDYILEKIADQGRKKTWISDKTGINYKSLITKLRTDCFTAYDLMEVSKVLHIDLNEMRNTLSRSDKDE
ncbi:hypothetical protein [Priestia megaterium]|uniref:hypothetical protein n=1 Tax=Priestia megaterium TaxID=1404 RepID=UPI00112D74AF|nr:hypothetical protein [Priestia megaterium]TPF17994.1 hypothetical protein CBE78_01850 [Priestia megaterium]TPF22102.1 hypothetical protein CBE79_04355 [Priestia megaterium]